MPSVRSGLGWIARLIAGGGVILGVGQSVLVRAEPTSGERLLGDLQCTSCHASSPGQSDWILPKMAPRLGGLGQRIDPLWTQRFLAEPQRAQPGTTMPDQLHGLPSTERAAASEALAQFLSSGGSAPFRRQLPDRAAVARGEALYHQIGCVACHDPQNGAPQPAGSVPLPVLSQKWSVAGLQRFLRDPLSLRPSGRMPSLKLTEGEAQDIAQYLLRDTRVPAVMERIRFGGRIRSLEDLDAAEWQSTGPVRDFALPPLKQERNGAFRFQGWFQIDRPGKYTFLLKAAGSSRLSIAEGWRLGQDSWQRELVDGQVTLRLDPGWYPLVLDFVQRGSKEPSVVLEWEGPGVAREVFPTTRMRHTREAVEAPASWMVDATKVEAGRLLYERFQCGVCHDARPAPTGILSLASLRTDRGCLSPQPDSAAPFYAVSNAQRTSLGVALKRLQRPDLPSPTSRERLAQDLAAFRCGACHSRDGTGGVPADRDAFFTSAGEDLGDEGRLPPRLDGVGDKLRPEWLRRVLTEGAAVRPYLRTRMPQFGSNNVRGVADRLISLDRHPRPLSPSPDSIDAQREAGRKLVGTDGLSCIACHRFNRQPAHTLQVLDLLSTPERLNEDWFRRFLLDPNQFNVGTRMPSFWPDGVSPLPALLGGSTVRQEAAIWTYLAEGPKARFPEGLSRQSMELTVGGETVLYRGKLWEAGFRAVAVGHPGGWNFAFDAEEMRLALLWRGRFLNAGPHWGVQGMGQILPLGSNVVIFPRGPALAVLKNPETPWPTESSRALGVRFHGYQLDARKRPTLLYSMGEIPVEDSLLPREWGEGKGGVHRTLSLGANPNPGTHLRLAVGRIQPLPDQSWKWNDTVTIRVVGDGKPRLRGTGDSQELVVAVESPAGKPRLEVDYVW